MRASAEAVENIRVSTAGVATATTAPPGPETARRRVPAPAIELIGRALGIALITAVALGHSAVERRVLVVGRRPVDARRTTA